MNITATKQSFPSDDPNNSKGCWTAGPIIDSYERKGFNRSGEEMLVHELTTYQLEVFPPEELANQMQQSAPDIADHLLQESTDPHPMKVGRVSFLARVSLPNTPEESAAEVILTSTQPEDGGVYKHEIELPRHLLHVRESPIDTVLDSLNIAWQQHKWYPPY